MDRPGYWRFPTSVPTKLLLSPFLENGDDDPRGPEAVYIYAYVSAKQRYKHPVYILV